MAGSGLFYRGAQRQHVKHTSDHSRRTLLAATSLGFAAVAGCADDDPGDETDEEQDDPDEAENGEDEEGGPIEDVDHEDPDGEIEFAQPEDGAEVTSPVEIEANVTEFELEAVEDDGAEDGVGHLHVIVDEGCVEPAYVIPEEDGYYHLSEGETETELDLESGTYDLCLQAGDGIHNAYDLTDEITIDVSNE